MPNYELCKYASSCCGDSCVRCKSFEPVMNNYYFTFGSSDVFPYHNSYVIVIAEDEFKARNIFNFVFGLTEDGFARFSFCYTEQEWCERASTYYTENDLREIIQIERKKI